MKKTKNPECRIQNPESDILDSKKGFTLIELLVVVTISAFLSGLVILYSSVGRNEITLSVQSTAVAQTLARARSLAIATYATVNGVHTCAYGVLFDNAGNKYSLVAYQPAGGSGACSGAGTVSANGILASDLVEYSQSTWQVPLSSGVRFDAAPANTPLSLAIFYPPDPTILLSVSLCTPGDTGCRYAFGNASGSVGLMTGDGAASNTIVVGIGGQVGW